MSKYFLLIAWLLASSAAMAQTATLRLAYGTTNAQLNEVLRFQNIFLERVKLTGAAVRDKAYTLTVSEYRSGALVNTTTLFDGSKSEYFKLTTDSAAFRFFAQTTEKSLQLQLVTSQFSSRKLALALDPVTGGGYVLKDFLGGKTTQDVAVDKPIYLFAVITPTMHPDGSGSYCEVAQSGVSPDKLGTKFNIPHYFIVALTLR